MLTIPAKRFRAELIANHVLMAAGAYRGIICFTCGNAAEALRAEFARLNQYPQCRIPIIEVGGKGMLRPTTWFSPAAIAGTWPGFFDATSGHLSWPLMANLSRHIGQHCSNNGYLNDVPPGAEVNVPAGSGETAVCLALAYPERRFRACYNVPGLEAATEWHKEAPLNNLVDRLCSVTLDAVAG